MITYDLKKGPGVPLYEALYRCIREDILTGKQSKSTHLKIYNKVSFKVKDFNLFRYTTRKQKNV